MSLLVPQYPETSRFVLVGDHPAIDFANTLSKTEDGPRNDLGTWADVLDWLAAVGLAGSGLAFDLKTDETQALQHIREFRAEWKTALEALVAGQRISDDFFHSINRILAEDSTHDHLERHDDHSFRVVQSPSRLRGEKLVLSILARQIATFLAEANLEYLHHCANAESCVLYFYDTTKNHRRQWCSATACGNRHKVAAFRQRQARAKATK